MQLIHDTMHYMVFWGISISCKRYLTAGSRRGEIYTLRGPSLQGGIGGLPHFPPCEIPTACMYDASYREGRVSVYHPCKMASSL